MVDDERRDQGSSDEPTPNSNPPNRSGSSHRGDVTQILSAIERGDQQASEDLLPLVYDELRHLAAARMAQEKPGQTLQATALVHDAYIRLVDVDQTQHWNGRAQFFGAAAEAMRRILVDSVRRKKAAKRGGTERRCDVELAELAVVHNPDQLLAIHEALDGLVEVDAESAELVKLRYFVGLTVDEAAQHLGISPRKAKYIWAYARNWLRVALEAS